MGDVRYRAIALLVQRVLRTRQIIEQFALVGNDLLPDRIARLLDQTQVVRIDPDLEILGNPIAKVLVNTEPLEELLRVIDSVPE